MATNHIVLFEPEIPQNTGNIMRTCAGTNTFLHLIKPLGFKIDDAHMKRSAVNYLPHVHYKIYENWENFVKQNQGFLLPDPLWLKNTHEMDLSEKRQLLFYYWQRIDGNSKDILKANLDKCIRLPINDNIRSLNISNVAAIVIFEALRQQDYNDLDRFEPETLKGKDFLLK